MYYLHKIELGTFRHVIILDEQAILPQTYTYLNDAPIISGGKQAANKTGWTCGPIETENEANKLALLLAKHYGCDVMIDGKLLRLPYMGDPGKWVSNSDAAAALGKIKSKKKAKSSAENGKLGGRPKKVEASDD